MNFAAGSSASLGRIESGQSSQRLMRHVIPGMSDVRPPPGEPTLDIDIVLIL